MNESIVEITGDNEVLLVTEPETTLIETTDELNAALHAAQALASRDASAQSEANAAASEAAADADALATAADRVQVQTDRDHVDAQALHVDDRTTHVDSQTAHVDAQVAHVDTQVIAVDADATQTAADRVATGQDAAATAADRTYIDGRVTHVDTQTAAVDAAATQVAADRVQTGLDAEATSADRVQTTADAQATAGDATATAADRTQTGLDRTATETARTASETARTGAETAQAVSEAALAEIQVSVDSAISMHTDVANPHTQYVRKMEDTGPDSGLDADTLDGKQLATLESERATAIADAVAPKLDAATYTPEDVLAKAKTVDGHLSGLDADLLDGNHATDFATAAQGTAADSAVQPSDLATVATTGAYGDLAGTPANATSAVAGLMPADDKAKLDGVEAGATADQTKADIDALQIDADTVDGKHASEFALAGHNHDTSYTGKTSDTGAAVIPTGTTAQRPTGSGPFFRYNAETAEWEGYDGTSWGSIGGVAEGPGSGLDADLLDGNHASAFAAASHNHDASDITSGTLPGARMPTSIGGVGTYALMEAGGTFSPGSTRSGSSLKYANAAGASSSGSASGTWRCMGQTWASTSYPDRHTTVWVRIS